MVARNAVEETHVDTSTAEDRWGAIWINYVNIKIAV